MGVEKLNKLLEHVKTTYTYDTCKPNTIIIDGNNLLYNRTAAVYNSYLNRYYNAEFETPNEGILQQLFYITKSVVNSIVATIKFMCSVAVGEKNIFIVFDPPKTALYNIPGVGLIECKEDEEEKRKNSKNSLLLNKRNRIINIIKNDYENPEEITDIYNQLSYFQNDKNIKKLYTTIKNELLYSFNVIDKTEICNIHESMELSTHVHFIQSISEADLVICNLTQMFNYAPILICSADSDYFVLCSNVKNVYKTDITTKKPIYNTYDMWRETYGPNITFEDIIHLATLAGNDYTSHSMLCGFKYETYLSLYKHDYSGLSKLKKIRSCLQQNKSIPEIIKFFGGKYETSILIYRHINDNCEFEKLKEVDKPFKKYIDGMINECIPIYDFYSTTEYAKIENPYEYIYKLYNNIDEININDNTNNVNVDIDINDIDNINNIDISDIDNIDDINKNTNGNKNNDDNKNNDINKNKNKNNFNNINIHNVNVDIDIMNNL